MFFASSIVSAAASAWTTFSYRTSTVIAGCVTGVLRCAALPLKARPFPGEAPSVQTCGARYIECSIMHCTVCSRELAKIGVSAPRQRGRRDHAAEVSRQHTECQDR